MRNDVLKILGANSREVELMPQGNERAKRKCISCEHNVRINAGGRFHLISICEIDMHYIGFLESDMQYCINWEEDMRRG